MRQLIRRLRTCESGAGTVEYALLFAIIAIGLAGVLALFRNAVGGLTNRTAVSVSTQTGGAYGRRTFASGGSSGGTVVLRPAPADPDSAAVEPDSTSTNDGSTSDGSPAASLDPAIQ